jgi:hypothetical protein
MNILIYSYYKLYPISILNRTNSNYYFNTFTFDGFSYLKSNRIAKYVWKDETSSPKALESAWMNDPDPFIGIINKAAMGAALAPAAIMSLPSIYQYGGGALKYGYEGMKLYHNSIGVNGGYVNAGLNYLNQSYTTGELGMNGKSISGLIMAGSLPFNASLFGQIAVGASDPWGSINFSSSKGLYLDGFVSGNQTIQKTMALSTMGLFGPLYQQVPLFNSKGINFLIEQGAMAPMQKALQNVEE